MLSVRIWTFYLGVLLVGTVFLRGQEVTFYFTPPDGFSETVKVRQRRHITTGNKVREEINEMRFRWTVNRKESGYRVERHIISNWITHNGQIIASPMIEAMEGVTLRYNIDDRGRISDIEGYDRIFDNLKSSLPPQFMQNIGNLFSSKSLRKKNFSEWNHRIGKFSGRTVHIGEVWISREQMLIPGGRHIFAYTASVSSGWQKCSTGNCLKILFFYDSDPVKLHQRISGISTIDPSQFVTPTTDTPIASLSGEGERLVNPTTLLAALEKSTRVLESHSSRGNDKAATSFRIIESTEYTVDPD